MENGNRLKWQDICFDLKTYFLLRWVMAGGVLIALIVFTLVTKLYKPGIVLIVAAMLYAAYVGYILLNTMYGKVLVYEGLCVQTDYVKKDISVPIMPKKSVGLGTVYGKSQIILQIHDKYFVVPVGYSFPAKEGNTVKVYTLRSEIFVTNEDTFTINNPILVKVSKTQN